MNRRKKMLIFLFVCGVRGITLQMSDTLYKHSSKILFIVISSDRDQDQGYIFDKNRGESTGRQ